MTNSHTPGPWTVATAGTYVRVDAPKGSKNFPNGQPIAQVSCGPGKSAVENAHLIAAAPQLLDALLGLDLTCTVDVLNPCWDERETDTPVQHWGGGKACAPCNARAAIAQARG